jgi:hypothetical protein
MQRVTRSTAVAVQPAAPASPGPAGFFTPGNPGGGIPATIPGYEWFNAVQEELVGTIARGGLTPDAADQAQLRKAMDRLYGGGLRTVTANTTLTADDAGLVLVDASGGNRTITLPAASAANARPIRLDLVRTDTTANTVTIQRAGSDTIEGGTTVLLAVRERMALLSDGGSAWRVAGSPRGRLIGAQTFLASGTYVPPPNVSFVLVEVQGGGGGGGGATLPGAGNVSLGSPGIAGTYARGLYDVHQLGASVPVTVGGGGAGQVGGGGLPAGSSSFGVLLSCPGGGGGSILANQAPPAVNATGSASGAAAGTVISQQAGSGGTPTLALSAGSAVAGAGGASAFGAGGVHVGINVSGADAVNRGAGGGGCVINVGGGGSYRGGNGAAGQVIIWEFG